VVISVIEHIDNMCVVKRSVFGYGVITKRRQILVIGLLAEGMHLTSRNHQ
jgi:hypothetical protein